MLEALEQIRSPFLDRLMLLVTELGQETVLIVLGLVILWCVSKKLGRYLLSVGLTGVVLTQWMKIVCAVPRPWVRNPNLSIVEAARPQAGGYSFPSGHCQSAAAVFGSLGRWYRKPLTRAICAVLILLVMFSRMYLGVHTLWDVLTGCGLSLALTFLFYPLFLSNAAGKARRTLLGILIFSVLFVLFMLIFPFSPETDPDNLAEASKNAWTLLGASLAVYLAFEMDERYVHYDTKAVWYVQLIKAVLGTALVLALRILLKDPLTSLFAGRPAGNAVRYFVMCFVAAGLWPMAFPYLNRLGKKK